MIFLLIMEIQHLPRLGNEEMQDSQVYQLVCPVNNICDNGGAHNGLLCAFELLASSFSSGEADESCGTSWNGDSDIGHSHFIYSTPLIREVLSRSSPRWEPDGKRLFVKHGLPPASPLALKGYPQRLVSTVLGSDCWRRCKCSGNGAGISIDSCGREKNPCGSQSQLSSQPVGTAAGENGLG